MNLGWMMVRIKEKRCIPAIVPVAPNINGFEKDPWNPALSRERQRSFLMAGSHRNFRH
jgi:hypothetical protein